MGKRTPQHDERERTLLTALVLGSTYERILAHPETPLTGRQRAKLSQLLSQRASGVPIAYLTGSQWFYRRDFIVDPGVLVPRPETEHVVEAALAMLPRGFNGTVADVGTGSGCIGVTIACERPGTSIVLIDNSLRALAIARRNAARFRVASRTTLLRGDLLTPLHERRIAPDVIITNLPYATPFEYGRVRKEPRAAIVGGPDGLAVYRRFFRQVRRYGFLPACCIVETDPRRMTATKKLAVEAFGNGAAYRVIRDLAGRERVLTINLRNRTRVTSPSPAGQAVLPRPRSARR